MKQKLWVIEEFYEDEWKPINEEVYYTREKARENLKWYKERWGNQSYRVAKYTRD
jgi:hypothetical protein